MTASGRSAQLAAIWASAGSAGGDENVSAMQRDASGCGVAGIYIEELRTALVEIGLSIPFIGVNQRALKKLEGDLQSLLTK